MWKSLHHPPSSSSRSTTNNTKKVWKVEKPNVWQKLFRVKLEPASCWGTRTNNNTTNSHPDSEADAEPSSHIISQPKTKEHEDVDDILEHSNPNDPEVAATGVAIVETRNDTTNDDMNPPVPANPAESELPIPPEARSQDCSTTTKEDVVHREEEEEEDVRESIVSSTTVIKDNYFPKNMNPSNNHTPSTRPRASSYDHIPPPSPSGGGGGKIPRPTTKRSTTSAFQPPTPVHHHGAFSASISSSFQQQQRPPIIQNRAISYTSTGSRHRRDSAVLPDLQSILSSSNEEPPLSIVPDIPKTLDRLKCFRQVSALEDDCSDTFEFDTTAAAAAEKENDFYNDDDRDNLSYSSDEEDDDEQVDPMKVPRKQNHSSSTSEETASPASVIPDAPEDWMNAWVNNNNNTSIEPIRSSDMPPVSNSKQETDDSTVETSVAEPVYVPITPRPDKASSDAVFTAGWAAVLMEDLPPITTDGCSSGGEDVPTTRQRRYSSSTVESTLPTITPQSLYYVQLLHGPVLELSTANECLQFALDPEEIFPCPVSFAMLSKRTGHAVIIESATKQYTILPVLLSTTHLQRLVSLRPPSISLEKALGSEWNGADYASHAQHDASMHLRFAMDAALRMARS